MTALILAFALLGHGWVWVAAVNWTHAVRMPKWLCNVLTLAEFLLGGTLPLLVAVEFWRLQIDLLAMAGWRALSGPALGYVAICGPLGAYALAAWGAAAYADGSHTGGDPLRAPPRDRVVRRSRRSCAAVRRAAALSVRLPGNEILELDVVERGLQLAQLPAELAGLSILHFSDVHLAGKIDRGYYENLVRAVNAEGCDLIVLTGDLVDKPECIDWLPTTLGQLRAEHGVYFILGNHDRRRDHVRIRKTLVDCGLIDVGGVRREVTVRGRRIVVAGNERPWFRQLPDLAVDSSHGPQDRPLRIVLTHGPDQFGWACDAGADLVLAGHTHAGQIQLPWIGPVFSPCASGVRYVEGVYRRGATVLHVTRGVSATMAGALSVSPGDRADRTVRRWESDRRDRRGDGAKGALRVGAGQLRGRWPVRAGPVSRRFRAGASRRGRPRAIGRVRPRATLSPGRSGCRGSSPRGRRRPVRT